MMRYEATGSATGTGSRQEGDSQTTMVRTSATGATSTVIRTYAAADRASAERSFLRERQQAAARGWEPKSRRWRSEGREHVLTVVYESSADAGASLAADAEVRVAHRCHHPSTAALEPGASAPSGFLQGGGGDA